MGVMVQDRKGTRRCLAAGLLTLLFCTSMAVTACSNQYEDASAAHERGDFVTAFRLMKPLAERGDAKAQYNLGVMYHQGEGVPQDFAEAMKWYRRAAEQGIPEAHYNLGVMYHQGEGVPPDHAEAVKWFRKAAEQGHAQAQYNLGVMYRLGDGVAQDNAETMKWYRKAAEQNISDAQYFLGITYDKGQGVPQDSVQAYMWYSLAASRFSESDAGKREMVLMSRGIVASKMTPEQLEEAQRLAREWKPKKEGNR
jgi:uncharacterized protein